MRQLPKRAENLIHSIFIAKVKQKQIPPNPPFLKWGTRQALKGEGFPL